MSLFYREARAAEIERQISQMFNGRAVWMEGKDLEPVIRDLRSTVSRLREGTR